MEGSHLTTSQSNVCWQSDTSDSCLSDGQSVNECCCWTYVMAVNYSNSTGEYVAEPVFSISEWSVAM
jgi:hypothetical protein